MARNDMALLLRVNANSADAMEALRRLQAELNRAGNQARRANQGFSGIGSSIRNMAAGLAAAVGVGSFAKDLIRVTVATEKLQAMLKTSTGSVQAASAAWDQLAAFAAKTPFAVDEVVEAFIRLKNLGLDPSNEALMAYGNVASSMGKTLMQFAEAVADAVTGEFERLKEFGIKASKEGEKVTFTFRDMETTVGNSAKEIEGYLRRLGEVEFAGAMDDQMRTMGASIDRMKEQWEEGLRQIGKSRLGDAIKGGIDQATGYLKDFGEQWTLLYERVANKKLGLDFTVFDDAREELDAINKAIAETQTEGARMLGLYNKSKGQAGIEPIAEKYKSRASEEAQKLNALEARRAEIIEKIRATSLQDYQERQAAQDKLNDQSNLTYHQAKAVPKLATDPKLAKVNDELATNITALIAKASEEGITLGITSGFRTTERQAQLWAEALKKYGSAEIARKYVAPPGKSNHEKGDAVDISYLKEQSKQAQDWLDKNGLKFNLGFRVKTEAPGSNMGFVHTELAVTAKSRAKEDREAETLATKKLNEEKRIQNELERETARVYEATRTPVEKLNLEVARLNELRAASPSMDADLLARGITQAQDEFVASMLAMQSELERTQTPAQALEQTIASLSAQYQAGNLAMEPYIKAVQALQGAYEGAKKPADELRTAAERMAEAGQQMGDSMAQAFEDAVLGAGNLQDILQALLRDIARILMQKAVTEPMGNFLGDFFKNIFSKGFASGGIMTTQGPMPLLSYASGGIASSPQLALFGEGRLNEAYVPLPDGRNIPVVLSDKGQQNSQPLKITVNNLPGQDSRITQDSQGGLTIDTVRATLAADMHQGGVPWVGAMERRYGMSRGRV